MSDERFLIDGKTPWEFACGWYTPDEIERSIANRHKSGFVRNDIPADIESRAFAEWLCDQYRLAMNKGFGLTRADLTAARAEIERLRVEVSQAGFDPAWREVQRLIATNAKHRKGFSLRDVPDNRFVIDQARGEMDELSEALERHDACITGTDREIADELADLLGVLFHFAQRMGYTPETLTRTMLNKFRQRFNIEAQAAARQEG